MKAVCVALLMLTTTLKEVSCGLEMEIVHDGKVISRRDGHGDITDLSERKAVIAAFNWPNKIVPYVLDETVTKEDPCVDRWSNCQDLVQYCVSHADQIADNCDVSCEKCADGTGTNMGQRIREAMDTIETFTCLKFTPKTDADEHYVRFNNSGGSTGCWSDALGKKGGEQIVNIAENIQHEGGYSGCDFRWVILHEIGHAVGLYHEQMRTDRDDYLTINWNNIPENKRSQFEKARSDMIDNYGVPYDYLSIMQYGQTAFGYPPGAVTMEAKDPFYQDKMGDVKALSMYDIQILNKMYECPVKYFRIRHIATDKVLDTRNNVKLKSMDEPVTKYQKFRFDGKQIRSRHYPGRVLTMVKDTSGSGWADVSMKALITGDKAQEWEHVAKGLYNEWEHKMYALELAVDGVRVGCNGTMDETDPKQQWAFEKI